MTTHDVNWTARGTKSLSMVTGRRTRRQDEALTERALEPLPVQHRDRAVRRARVKVLGDPDLRSRRARNR